MAKQRVGLLFGGCSGEHEVSINSARAIASALSHPSNAEKYDLLPVYIQKDGHWLAGTQAQQVLDSGVPLPPREANPDLATAASPEEICQPITVSRRLERWMFPPEVGDVGVWFPILHGPNGEDGTVQGLLTLMQVPFVGSGVLSCALAMDKLAMKVAFAAAGLSQVKYMGITRDQVWSDPCVFPKLCDRIEAELGYPCFVKPANLGSSVGISKAKSRQELEKALDSAASYDRRIIVEAGIVAREVECAVLGNDQAKASVIGEITFQSDFYDYETKYTSGQADLHIPAPLPEAVAQKIQDMALQAFKAVDAAGLARVDFFYEEATGNILINELNSLPGFTATSMYPQLWAASGVPFGELVDSLIQLAFERHRS